MTFNKKFKKLNKFYVNKLKKLGTATNALSYNSFLDYIIYYLKYRRDMIILSSEKIDFSTDPQVTTLCYAIMEYELAATCIHNYYQVNEKGIPTPIDSSKSKEEINTLYSIERQQHLSNFWELVKTNIEGWFLNYETSL